MTTSRPAQQLRIYIGDSDRHDGRPLHEAIVEAARRAGLAGATVFKSPLGFGAGSTIHSAKILQLSGDLPLVIEIIDAPEKISAFLPVLDGLMDGGLVTRQHLEIVIARGRKAPPHEG